MIVISLITTVVKVPIENTFRRSVTTEISNFKIFLTITISNQHTITDKSDSK